MTSPLDPFTAQRPQGPHNPGASPRLPYHTAAPGGFSASVSSEASGDATDFFTNPDANILDATETQRKALRAQLDQSLLLFCGLFFDYHEFTPHWHGPICNFIGRWGQGPTETDPVGWKRLGIQVPRDTGKTTLATRANALWQVARDPLHNPRVGIYHANKEKVREWIRGIRNLVDSNIMFQVLYEDMLPPGLSYRSVETTGRQNVPRGWRWSDDAIDFQRQAVTTVEASISAHGITGSNQGYHFTHLIKDDLIGKAEADSEVEMQKAKELVDVSRFLESPANKGNDLFVYTRWTYNDCYRHFRERWPGEYRIFHRRALERDPDTGLEYSTFPEKWTTEELFAERKRDPFEFNRQFQSTPMAGREIAFNPAWNRFFTVAMVSGYPTIIIDEGSYDPTRSRHASEEAPREVPLALCDMALLWDPAPSEASDRRQNRHANNGKVLLARDPWGRDFILAALGTRKDPLDELVHAIQLSMAWGNHKAAVEEVNFSKLYKHFGRYVLDKEPAFKGYDLVWLEQNRPKASKDTRIGALLPDWRAGFIYLNHEHTDLIQTEALEYPNSTTRDCLDALASRDAEPVPISTPSTPDEAEWYAAEAEAQAPGGVAGRDPVTGY